MRAAPACHAPIATVQIAMGRRSQCGALVALGAVLLSAAGCCHGFEHE
jgi:hypothetical protein